MAVLRVIRPRSNPPPSASLRAAGLRLTVALMQMFIVSCFVISIINGGHFGAAVFGTFGAEWAGDVAGIGPQSMTTPGAQHPPGWDPFAFGSIVILLFLVNTHYLCWLSVDPPAASRSFFVKTTAPQGCRKLFLFAALVCAGPVSA